MAKVVITDYEFPSVTIEQRLIEEAGGEFVAFRCSTEQEIIAFANDADALLVQWAPITEYVINNLKSCKVIVRYGIGVDNIDLKAAQRHGIVVCNVPDYCIDEVADHTFALALSLSRQISTINSLVREGHWKIVPPRPMLASRQMNFVTIGLGRIARAVLERARACRFQLSACDPYLASDVQLPRDIALVDMEEALRTADVLSLHLPLNKNTKHLIDRDALAKMKPTALLVNTARGGLVDTAALAMALSSSEIAGAAVDVLESEPPGDDCPLGGLPNVLMTSHVAWYSELSVSQLQRRAAEQAIRALNGEFNNRVV
jgi:D-3-phosphoglycerate dehydrogenase